MKICSVKFSDEDIDLLDNFMRLNNIKNKSLAIRECIKIANNHESMNEFIFEVNSKLNRLVHNLFLTKKLLEQLFANYHFRENLEIENDEKLNDFYKNINSYKNKFLG